MDFSTIIALLNVVVANLPGAIKTAEELYALGVQFFGVINNKPLTEEQRTALYAQIDADVAEALTPLPPARPGDPDFQA